MTAPITGTREWAASTVNCVRGCQHDCTYCYAKANAVRFGRCTAAEWSTEVVNEAAVARSYGKRRGRVMFPSAHDITPGNLDACLTVLRKLLVAGNEVLIVSKPHLECIKTLCRELMQWRGAWHGRQRVAFRFTIGSASSDTLRFWEPGAPRFAERANSLQHAYQAGFETSVSMEPMLDDEPEAVIGIVEPYVTDTIWLGRANMLDARLAFNGAPAEVVAAGRELMTAQCDEWCRDLYERWKGHPKIRFKDSIKRIVGIAGATRAGEDR